MRFASLLASLALLAALPNAPKAADTLEFVVPENDGYGVAECMKPGMACGQVIADAWCEAHGHAHAAAFGVSDDITGAIKINASNSSSVPPGSIVIRCGE